MNDEIQPVIRGFTRPAAQPLHPKLRIGKYELVGPIGEGGMGNVWIAKRVEANELRPHPSKFVAIKLMLDSKLGDRSHARLFHSEARLAMLLSHGNIVQTFDFGEEFGRSYIVMEWVDGITLSDLRPSLKRQMPEFRHRMAAYITGQLLYALGYAHSLQGDDGLPLQIVHRDVSPHNVLVSAQGDIKLGDFGVAHSACEESSGLHVKGKLRYMAPEHLSGDSRHPKVDLYAAGAILHELLSGRKFRGNVSDQRVLSGLIYLGDIPPLQGVPAELETVRRALLEPKPEKRIASAKEAGEMLRAWGGYSEMKHEVGRLVAEATGIDTPRSGYYMSPFARKPLNASENLEEGSWAQTNEVPAPREAPASHEAGSSPSPTPPPAERSNDDGPPDLSVRARHPMREPSYIDCPPLVERTFTVTGGIKPRSPSPQRAAVMLPVDLTATELLPPSPSPGETPPWPRFQEAPIHLPVPSAGQGVPPTELMAPAHSWPPVGAGLDPETIDWRSHSHAQQPASSAVTAPRRSHRGVWLFVAVLAILSLGATAAVTMLMKMGIPTQGPASDVRQASTSQPRSVSSPPQHQNTTAGRRPADPKRPQWSPDDPPSEQPPVVLPKGAPSPTPTPVSVDAEEPRVDSVPALAAHASVEPSPAASESTPPPVERAKKPRERPLPLVLVYLRKSPEMTNPQLRMDGRRLPELPSQKDLPIGKHTFRWRDGTDPWNAKSVTLSKGCVYRLHVTPQDLLLKEVCRP